MKKVYHATQLLLFPIEKHCSKCNKDKPLSAFVKDKSNPDGLTYTCKECRNASRGPVISLICVTCEKVFQRAISRVMEATEGRGYGEGVKGPYCSRACGRPIDKHLPATLGEEYLQGATLQDLALKYGVTFAAIRYHLMQAGVSRRPMKECHVDKSRIMGKPYHPPRQPLRHTKEYKQHMREIAIERLREGPVSRVSKVETHVAEELTRRAISFIPQYGIRDSQGKVLAGVDFMLADGRAIEVNGTYWHADPRKYPDGPMYDAQKKKVANDERKQRILAECGIPLIILWEMDLTADLTSTIDNALNT